ncbi:MAG: tetratricopeptide repeat protein [Crenarchaeota archaeon]|nr:MAG: tetratricopeptide repeat protein [Thermoproteota archaeon]RDJ34264.1 MAG: tetratricopeptide repeat protein [Thermoproteota archaeon]RDJ36623.1 MAG: tetratricopeptide repeat protein [Thermoproteota archaeon]RDJ37848.1 MAG: tetratricopeptide repeat protein [Thermoproteota archaeon]
MAQVEQSDSFTQGCVHYKNEEYEQALSAFDSVLAEDSKHLDSLCMKSMTLSKIGKFEDALACCDEALGVEPNDNVLLNNKGYFESILGNNQKAIEVFDQILKREPENISVLYNKALCFSRMEKYEESIRIYNKILEIDPEHTDSLFNKGNDLHKLGKFKEASLCYEQVLKINPSHNGAKNNHVLSNSKISSDSLENYLPKVNDELFEKLNNWLSAGRPETKDFPLDTSLIELLPEKKEDAVLVLTKAKEIIVKNFPKIESTDPHDVIALDLAKAMSKQKISEKPSKNKDKTKTQKKSKAKKSHKSFLILGLMISVVGFIGVYDAYPELLFSFNPSQLSNMFDSSLSFVSESPLQEKENLPIQNIAPIASSYPQVESDIVQLINEKRLNIGRGAFLTHPELSTLALKHSQDMASRNRVDQALSTDGLPVTREYADKLPICVENAAKYSDSKASGSSLNIYSGNIPLDALTAETIISEWIQKDVKETLLRGTTYSNVGTGVSFSSDGTLYVSQIYC